MTNADIEKAKRLLEDEGYTVSEKPIAWRTLRCVVELPVRSKDASEKKFKRFVESRLGWSEFSRASFEKHTGMHVQAFGELKLKEGARVINRTVRNHDGT
jgi:hypothetical protein